MSGAEAPLPAAVLWDMDGTLVDTEPYWMEAEIALTASHGATWTLEDGLRMVGQPLVVSAGMIVAETGIPLTPEQVVEHLIAEVGARVRAGAPWRPGVSRLLRELGGAGVPMALVTMSYTSLADAVLGQLPEGTFASVVTGDRVTHGKPHPEPYLTAAAALGVDPARSVAIEDSPAGLASAEAAGCRSLGVQAHVPVAAAPGRSRLASLEHTTLDDLARIAAGHPVDTLA